MELAIAPPSRVVAGLNISQPLVVTFKSADGDKRENGGGLVLHDFSGVWAFVSLTTTNMQQNLAPPRTDLLHGRTVDSVHPVHREQEGDQVTIAYSTFRDLVITEPGKYRIKVTLIDMNALGESSGDSGPDTNLFSPLLTGEGHGAGKVLCVLHSEIIDVVQGGQHGFNSECAIKAHGTRADSMI